MTIVEKAPSLDYRVASHLQRIADKVYNETFYYDWRELLVDLEVDISVKMAYYNAKKLRDGPRKALAASDNDSNADVDEEVNSPFMPELGNHSTRLLVLFLFCQVR